MGGFRDTLSYRTCIFYLIYILKIHVFRLISSEETSYTVVYSEAGHFSLRHIVTLSAKSSLILGENKAGFRRESKGDLVGYRYRS